MRRRVLIAVAAAAAAAALALTVLGRPGGTGIPYPEELPGGYPLVSLAAGPEAVRMVTGIHWSPERVPVVDAVVAVYGDGTRLWASRVSGDACAVADAMAEKIARFQGSVPYTAPVPHEIGGTRVYLTMDVRTGRLHAFWCSGDLVVWVELGSAGIPALEALASFYPGGR